ncbi:MAG: hypothetical protein ACPGUD_03625 [Parashewanella sp.]
MLGCSPKLHLPLELKTEAHPETKPSHLEFKHSYSASAATDIANTSNFFQTTPSYFNSTTKPQSAADLVIPKRKSNHCIWRQAQQQLNANKPLLKKLHPQPITETSKVLHWKNLTGATNTPLTFNRWQYQLDGNFVLVQSSEQEQYDFLGDTVQVTIPKIDFIEAYDQLAPLLWSDSNPFHSWRIAIKGFDQKSIVMIELQPAITRQDHNYNLQALIQISVFLLYIDQKLAFLQIPTVPLIKRHDKPDLHFHYLCYRYMPIAGIPYPLNSSNCSLLTTINSVIEQYQHLQCYKVVEYRGNARRSSITQDDSFVRHRQRQHHAPNLIKETESLKQPIRLEVRHQNIAKLNRATMQRFELIEKQLPRLLLRYHVETFNYIKTTINFASHQHTVGLICNNWQVRIQAKKAFILVDNIALNGTVSARLRLGDKIRISVPVTHLEQTFNLLVPVLFSQQSPFYTWKVHSLLNTRTATRLLKTGQFTLYFTPLTQAGDVSISTISKVAFFIVAVEACLNKNNIPINRFPESDVAAPHWLYCSFRNTLLCRRESKNNDELLEHPIFKLLEFGSIQTQKIYNLQDTRRQHSDPNN